MIPALAFDKGLEHVVAVDKLVGKVHQKCLRHQRRDRCKVWLHGVFRAHQERILPGSLRRMRRSDAQDHLMWTCKRNEIRRVERPPAQFLEGLDLKTGAKPAPAQCCNLIRCQFRIYSSHPKI